VGLAVGGEDAERGVLEAVASRINVLQEPDFVGVLIGKRAYADEVA